MSTESRVDAEAKAVTDPWKTWLTQRERQSLSLPHYRRAAVLVPLTLEPDPRLILTVRSTDLPTHQGQISFAGGSLEAGESVIEAALREAHEEMGLEPKHVQVLGELDDVFTPVGFHVTPVLSRIPAQPNLLYTAEVAEILLPSVSELRALVPVSEHWKLANGQQADGQKIVLYRYFWQGHDIWGMTARIIHTLLTEGPH